MFKIPIKTIVTGMALLVLTVSPSLAQTVPETSSDQTNTTTEKPMTPEQMRQHHQKMLVKM